MLRHRLFARRGAERVGMVDVALAKGRHRLEAAVLITREARHGFAVLRVPQPSLRLKSWPMVRPDSDVPGPMSGLAGG